MVARTDDDLGELLAPISDGYAAGAMRRCMLCRNTRISAVIDAVLERLAAGENPSLTYWVLHERLKAKYPDEPMPSDPRSMLTHLKKHRPKAWALVLEARAR